MAARSKQRILNKFVICLMAIVLVLAIRGIGLLNTKIGTLSQVIDSRTSQMTRYMAADRCRINSLYNRVGVLNDRWSRFNFSDTIERVLPSVVEVKLCNDQGIMRTHGAGFVLNVEKGYVVTVRHVVDKRERDGGPRLPIDCFVGIDKLNVAVLDIYEDQEEDFAVLILDVNDVNYCDVRQLSLANEVSRVGEIVFVIGHPWRFTNSVSMGIVSNPNSKHANFSLWDGIQPFRATPESPRIQVDAAINPGNSGGPLIDLDGDVIGVVVSIGFQDLAQNAGVNFAIPISRINESLLRFHKWLNDKEFDAALRVLIDPNGFNTKYK